MPVKEITSQEEYQNTLSTAEATKLVSVVFSDQYDGIFLKVDVDQFSALADEAGITAMPTFQYFKGNQKVAEKRGDEAPEIESLIKQYQ
ncbi:hypothetical protein BGX28_005774 [Mortierella sp. GBA30]|nr:hypothetical protein BGX28_005774 [Mortierella sp. GBA30]